MRDSGRGVRLLREGGLLRFVRRSRPCVYEEAAESFIGRGRGCARLRSQKAIGSLRVDGGGGRLYRAPMPGQALSAAYRKNIPFGRDGPTCALAWQPDVCAARKPQDWLA